MFLPSFKNKLPHTYFYHHIFPLYLKHSVSVHKPASLCCTAVNTIGYRHFNFSSHTRKCLYILKLWNWSIPACEVLHLVLFNCICNKIYKGKRGNSYTVRSYVGVTDEIADTLSLRKQLAHGWQIKCKDWMASKVARSQRA
jgi:hypothetical protein